jgi:hypothetical protein
MMFLIMPCLPQHHPVEFREPREGICPVSGNDATRQRGGITAACCGGSLGELLLVRGQPLIRGEIGEHLRRQRTHRGLKEDPRGFRAGIQPDRRGIVRPAANCSAVNVLLVTIA